MQVFLKEIKDLDAEQKEGILNQIDFERSIYVLNKADSLSRTVLENESNEKYRQFIDKKTVLCSAEPAMQLRVNGSMEGKHHVLFVNPIKAEEKLIDLREYALLSEPIKKRTLNVERNILSTKAGNEALDRTAVSLIGNLLDEYASNSASIHKVSSYYSRLDWMFKHLSDEEQNKITNYNKKKEDLEKKEVAVKNSLKQECDNSLNSFNDQHTKDNMKKNLRDDMNKEYVVICNKIENCFDKKMSKKEYIEEIKKEVNETIKGNFEKSDDNLGKYNKIAKNKKTALCQFYSDTLKKNLSAAQNREEINDDDWKEIEKCIDQFEKKDDWKDFTINKKFSIQEMSMKEILTRILRPRQWLKGKIIEEFSMHWDKNIIEPFSDDLCRQIKKSNETLTDDVKKQIDTISPCLVQLNIEKHEAERAKNKFIDNKNKAQELKESCKNMISRGTIYV